MPDGAPRATDAVTVVRPQPGDALPVVLGPREEGADLMAWLGSDGQYVETLLRRHGAVMLRGFGLSDAADFERVAAAITPDLFADYGDLPAESASKRVYASTPYPADKTILFHNESAHLPSWPLRQFFFCVTAASEGGATALVDCRRIYERLDREIVAAFQRKGLLYVRSFIPNLDVAWQDFFRTTDRAAVERMCRVDGLEHKWLPDDGLRIWQRAPGVIAHPHTGEFCFFNQVQLHHVSCLDAETAGSIRLLFDDADLPRNVVFGDGSPIPDDYLRRIGELYERLAVDLTWQAGDLVVIDNVLVAHARRPFAGSRKILVAMGEMVHTRDLKPVPM